MKGSIFYGDFCKTRSLSIGFWEDLGFLSWLRKGGGGGGREREIFFFSFFPRPSPVYTDMRRLQGQTSDLCDWAMVVYYYQLNFHCSYHYLHCQHDYHCYNNGLDVLLPEVCFSIYFLSLSLALFLPLDTFSLQ